MNATRSERIIGLDVIRAVSIIVVVFGHSFSFWQHAEHIPLIGKVTPKLAEQALSVGVLGVELFFVLSGFLIGGILIKIFMSTDFSFRDVRNFWLRRWFRTLPNYWLILTINLILFHILKIALFEPRHLRAYIFLQNFRHPNFLNSLPEAWSLSVEEWFYLSLPVVMYLSTLVFRPANKSRFLLTVFIAYLAVFLIARFINAFDPINGPDPDEGIRKVVVFRLDAVMYGVLFAYLNYFRPAMLDKIKKHLLLIGAIGTLVLIVLAIRYNLIFRNILPSSLIFVRNAFLYLFVPLLFSLYLPYANSIKTMGSSRWSKVVTHISKISYSIYLVHFSLIFVLVFSPSKATGFLHVTALYVLYWTTVLIVASLLYRFYEYPVMRLRERFTTKKHENPA